jgi:C4-dicarboxylate-binding protein DctP
LVASKASFFEVTLMKHSTFEKFLLIAFVLVFSVALWWFSGVYWGNDRPQVQNQSNNGASYHLRFGHNIPTDAALHVAAQRFADEVKKHSQGRIQVTVFPAQELGTDQQMVEMARAGELDIILTPTAKLGPLVPEMQYVDLPFFFPDEETLYYMLDNEPGQMLLDKLQPLGLIGVTFWGNGFKHFTANRLLRTPEDWREVKVRIMKSRMLQTQFIDLGAQPIFIDFHRVYEALRDGVVEAQENPLVAIANLNLDEVQSHLIISNHAYLGYVFSISHKSLARLPEDLQDLLIDTAKALTPFEREETRVRESAFLELLHSRGMQVYTLDENERHAFAQALRHLPTRFEADIGADILSKTEEILWHRRYKNMPQSAQDELIIGIDTDLSGGAALAGIAIKRGAIMALDEINQRGGVLGKRLVLLARDNKAMPSIGINNITYFSRIPNLVAIIGGVQSVVALAEVEIVQQEGVPLLVSWAAAEGLTQHEHTPNYIFRLSLNDREAAPYLIEYALKIHAPLKYEKVALWLDNSVWGRNNERAMRDALAAQGIQPVTVEWLNRGQEREEYAAQLARIEQVQAQVIVLVANAIESIEVINHLGRSHKPLPVVSHWGVSSGKFWDAVRHSLSKVELVFPQTVSFIHPKSDKQHQFAQRYQELFGVSSAQEIFSPVGTAHAYELVHLLALALERAESSERRAVRDALEQIEYYAGMLKNYAPAFTPDNHEALNQSDYYMARYNDSGAIEPLPLSSVTP